MELPELRLPRGAERRDAQTLHGTVDQIPGEYRHLPIISTYRESVERFVSKFRYTDWKKEDALPASKEELLARFPSFPDLGIVDCAELFLIFGRRRIVIGSDEVQIGPLSVDLLNFFSRTVIDADEGAKFPSWKSMLESLAPVRLLRQEFLKLELVEALVDLGYNQRDLAFIGEMERVNASTGNYPSTQEIEAVAGLFGRDPLYPLLLKRLLGDTVDAVPQDLTEKVREESELSQL